MGTASHLYANDNDGEFLTHDWTYPRRKGAWFYRLGVYVCEDIDKISGFFRCPSGVAIEDYGDTSIKYDDIEAHYYTIDYIIRFYGSSGLGGEGTAPDGGSWMEPAKFSDITNPSGFMVFSDFYYGEKDTGMLSGTAGALYESKWTRSQMPLEMNNNRDKLLRHNDGINICYADGSVANIKGSPSLSSLNRNYGAYMQGMHDWYDEVMGYDPRVGNYSD